MFRFAILPDRCGGNRPGVFETAIAKLNLLQPEFVMTTGDLIDGYTTDPKVAAAQWQEFASLIAPLQMPLHHVPGNHDISNPPTLDAWRQHFGTPWSSFVYQNVLFLCLHTEDRPFGGLGEEQIEWAKKTLAENAGVKWTLVFFHRPLWREKNQAGFEQIRAALQDRPYTVFAAHYHHYLKDEVDGKNYYVLATAGGESQVRGAEFGELDHVVWVTMKPDGPVVANLPLSGILADDLVTAKTFPQVQVLREGSWLAVQPVIADGPTFNRLEIPIELRNPTDFALRVRGSLVRGAGVEFLPGRVDRVVPPQQTVTVAVQLKASSGTASVHAINEAGLEVTMTGTYEGDGKTPALALPATRKVQLDWRHPVPAAAAPVTLDGKLDDWPAELFTTVAHPMAIKEGWDWKGPDDGRFRFAVQQREGKLYVAIETTDDRVIAAANPDELEDQLMFILRTNTGNLTRAGRVGQTTDDTCVRETLTGMIGEFSVPLPANEKAMHLNFGWVDHDRPENTKPSVLWWRDPAVEEFGEFILAP